MSELILELTAAERARLESEARRLGIAPQALAVRLVREGIAHDTDEHARARLAADAIARIRALREGLPRFDARRAAREAREELEGRPTTAG